MAHAVNYQGNLDPAIEVVTVVATAATAQGDFVVEGPWFGVALNDAAIGDDLSIDIVKGKRCVGYSTVAVAATVGAAIYLIPTTGVYSASYADGCVFAGYATKVKDSNNYFEFVKPDTAIHGAVDGYTSAVKCVEVTIDAATDYSTTGKTVVLPVGAQIIMLRVHATATHTSGTVTLYNGTTAAHTAVVMATAGNVTAVTAGVVQAAFTVGTDAITLKTNSLGDAGIVQVWYI